MKQEQARELASKVLMSWIIDGANGSGTNRVADALHAAYEAERVAVPSDARLASIKETARGILMRRPVSVSSAIELANELEDAFERRYGGAK